jgi:hypothetical protein
MLQPRLRLDQVALHLFLAAAQYFEIMVGQTQTVSGGVAFGGERPADINEFGNLRFGVLAEVLQLHTQTVSLFEQVGDELVAFVSEFGHKYLVSA